MDYKIDDKDDFSNDVFGCGRVYSSLSSRYVQTLAIHIENYTKKELSNQADILNGMGGLFSMYSKRKEIIQQYWGIPIDFAGHSIWSGWWDQVDVGPQTALCHALAYGLTWCIVSNGSRTRRRDFPSWSWSGWIAPIKWPGTLWIHEKDVPSRIAAVRHDGTTVTLSKELVSLLSVDDHHEAAMFTYLLHIESEVVMMRFTLFETESLETSKILEQCPYVDVVGWKREWLNQLSADSLESDRFAFAATATATATTTVKHESISQSDRKFFWPLLLTPRVRRGDDLYQALCEQTFECIVLGDNCGLVVWTLDGRTERIGLIGLYPLPGKHEYTSFDGIVDNTVHIREHFPGSKRAIVLG
jgi:hypothetical protein